MSNSERSSRGELYEELRRLARQQTNALHDDDLDRFSALMDQRETVMTRLLEMEPLSRPQADAEVLSRIIAEIIALDHNNQVLLTKTMLSTKGELAELHDGIEATRSYGYGLKPTEARYLDKFL